MANDTLSIQFNESDLRRLHDLQRRLPNFLNEERLNKSVGQLLASQAKKNIMEGTPDGSNSYAFLDKKTVKKKGFAQPLIGGRGKGVKSGAMLRSISHHVGTAGTQRVINLTALHYAKYHQFGTKNMPQRPIFSIRAENVQDIMQFIENSFTRQLKNRTT
jgi:phage gpG-like protein